MVCSVCICDAELDLCKIILYQRFEHKNLLIIYYLQGVNSQYLKLSFYFQFMIEDTSFTAEQPQSTRAMPREEPAKATKHAQSTLVQSGNTTSKIFINLLITTI